MAGVDVSKYAHSPVHKAILTRDYASLGLILAALPPLCSPTETHSEVDSLAEEAKADAISTVIDHRDVPNRETPLQLAVKLGDATATELLMGAGADWSLQNEQGWSALQEAICAGEDGSAKIIVKHYQPLAWAKWCRRLPRLHGALKRMRNFYMEITFHFERSMIPFISRIAPSDTYKIWKRGSNLRANMTLYGFDGLKIQQSDLSILFIGDGSEDGKVPPGTLCMISHKEKEVMDAFDGACSPATEEEIQHEVNDLSQNSIFRPGIDVTQAVLFPRLNWRRQGRMESVGPWKAKVYDMHHVVVSVKSRRVPGAMKDDEFFSSCDENDTEREDYEDLLTEDERKQLEVALTLDSLEMTVDGLSDGFIEHQHSCYEQRDISIEDICTYDNGEAKQEKKLWFGNWGKRDPKYEVQKKIAPPRSSLWVDEKVSDLLGDSPSGLEGKGGRRSIEVPIMGDCTCIGRDRNLKRVVVGSEGGHQYKDNGHDNEYKKGLRPILWLSSNFPLQTEELLPMLDILANKVAIPVVPTIRVLVTFTKFAELQPLDEFCTPPSSPFYSSSMGLEGIVPQPTTRSWLQWIKAPYRQQASTTSGPCSPVEDIQDPFVMPARLYLDNSRRKENAEEQEKVKEG